MPLLTPFCPEFAKPPVVETRIGTQFKPLSGVRAAHFGLFWQECLGATDWQVGDDMPLLRRETERFDLPQLTPPPEDLGEIDSLAVRSVFRSKDERSTVHFQPDKLAYSFSRQGEPRPSYVDLRARFDPIFGKLSDFASRQGFGQICPDLWEVSYTNAIPKGALWQTPSDWHRIFPRLFPTGGPTVAGHDWATFEGEWFFNIPQQVGRVRVKASKAVVNQTGELVLLVIVRARGSLDSRTERTWSEGLDIGHESAVRAFYDLASEEARLAWGYRT